MFKKKKKISIVDKLLARFTKKKKIKKKEIIYGRAEPATVDTQCTFIWCMNSE